MKKKVIISIIVVLVLLALIAIPMRVKDGGSIEYSALLYKVTKYHQLAIQEESEESGYLEGWGIEILGMEIFNNVEFVASTHSNNEQIREQSTFLENLPDTYSLEDARLDGCVCFDNGNITEGQQIWDEFVEATKAKKDAYVRLAFYYTLDEEQGDPEYYESAKDDYPVLFIQELTFENGVYTLRWFEDGQEICKNYKYMMRYEGEPESETALYKSYLRYVLTNDNTVTWKQIEQGMISSQLGDAIDHQTVYENLDYDHNTQEYCNAKVLEVYEDYVVVECLDVTSGLLKAGTKTIVTKDVVSANGAPEMNVGESIRIVYNGLKRTQPEEMKIVYAIYHLDENGNVISD